MGLTPGGCCPAGSHIGGFARSNLHPQSDGKTAAQSGKAGSRLPRIAKSSDRVPVSQRKWFRWSRWTVLGISTVIGAITAPLLLDDVPDGLAWWESALGTIGGRPVEIGALILSGFLFLAGMVAPWLLRRREAAQAPTSPESGAPASPQGPPSSLPPGYIDLPEPVEHVHRWEAKPGDRPLVEAQKEALAKAKPDYWTNRRLFVRALKIAYRDGARAYGEDTERHIWEPWAERTQRLIYEALGGQQAHEFDTDWSAGTTALTGFYARLQRLFDLIRYANDVDRPLEILPDFDGREWVSKK